MRTFHTIQQHKQAAKICNFDLWAASTPGETQKICMVRIDQTYRSNVEKGNVFRITQAALASQ